MIRTLLLSMAFCALSLPAQAQEKETVVLLHGIAKSANDLKPVAKVLEAQGYQTLAISYPSTKKDLSGIAQWLRENDLDEEFWAKAGTVNFVTHSMGGLVVRRYLDRYKNDLPREKLGRAVMLAPPNKGSDVADLIHGLPPYKWYYGPAGEELTTDAQAENKSDIYYELGIIAGTKEWPYIVAAFVVPGKSDGRVSVENTKLKGMADHVTVPGTHTFIMDRKDVQDQIVNFIKNGEFERKTK